MKAVLRTFSALFLALVVLGGAALDLRAGVWPGRGVPAPGWGEVRDGSYVDAVEERLDRDTSLKGLLRPRYAELDYLAFGSLQAGVVEGEDGWLFLRDRVVALDPQQDAAMERTMTALGRVNELLAARGIELVVVVVPRALTVYPDLAPDLGEEGIATSYGDLVEGLRSRGVAVPDFVEALRAAPRRTYFKNDNHWRPEGSMIAARETARFIADEVLGGAPPPGEPIALEVRRGDEEVFRGDELRRLGFTEGGAIERRFLDSMRRIVVFDPADPDQPVYSAEGLHDFMGIGTSMSGNQWPFLTQVMVELGVGMSVYTRAGVGAAYRGVDLFRYWVGDLQRWPKVLVWEIPEDILAREDRYVFEPLESIAAMLEHAPFDVELVALDRIEVTGATGRESIDERDGARVDAGTRFEFDVSETPLVDGTMFHLELLLEPGRSQFGSEARIEWFGGADGQVPLGEARRWLRVGPLPHAVAVTLDVEPDERVTRIVVHPADRPTWVAFGRFGVYRPRTR